MIDIFALINSHEIISATIILVAIIDIIGSSPVILSLRAKGMKVSAT